MSFFNDIKGGILESKEILLKLETYPINLKKSSWLKENIIYERLTYQVSNLIFFMAWAIPGMKTYNHCRMSNTIFFVFNRRIDRLAFQTVWWTNSDSISRVEKGKEDLRRIILPLIAFPLDLDKTRIEVYKIYQVHIHFPDIYVLLRVMRK